MNTAAHVNTPIFPSGTDEYQVNIGFVRWPRIWLQMNANIAVLVSCICASVNISPWCGEDTYGLFLYGQLLQIRYNSEGTDAKILKGLSFLWKKTKKKHFQTTLSVTCQRRTHQNSLTNCRADSTCQYLKSMLLSSGIGGGNRVDGSSCLASDEDFKVEKDSYRGNTFIETSWSRFYANAGIKY